MATITADVANDAGIAFLTAPRAVPAILATPSPSSTCQLNRRRAPASHAAEHQP